MTQTQMETANRLFVRSNKVRSLLSDVQNIAEGGPSRPDPLNQRVGSKQEAVMHFFDRGGNFLRSEAWEKIYDVIVVELRTALAATEAEFSEL